jgi:antitoxin component of MazEF toxin-antitoxin module
MQHVETMPGMRSQVVSFSTTMSQTGNNTGIEVPPDIVEALGAGKRAAVVASLTG